MVLITNGSSQSQRHKIDKSNLSGLFDLILIEGGQGIGKPFFEIHERALAALDLTAEEVWMIGDNMEWDVIAPQSVGIKGIWVKNKNLTLPCGIEPFLTITNLTEIECHKSQQEPKFQLAFLAFLVCSPALLVMVLRM